MESEKLSITEIAKRAGTSAATVSRVINHPELVNSETAQLIRSSMEELNYVPRTSKKFKAKKLILISVPEITNPFYSEIIKGITASTNNHSYYTLINQDSLEDSRSINNFIKLLKSVKACGVILCSPLNSQYYEQIGSLMPIVQCCEYNSEDYSYVSIDDFQAAYNVMEHIYSQGRREISFVNGPLKYKYARERQRGYEAFLDHAGIMRTSNLSINLAEINYDMAFASVCQLLTSSAQPDAIFASSDLVAAAAIKAAKLHHIRVPEDLIVVGFDNINISTISDPAITTINQPQFQLGYTAGEIIHEHISSPTAYKQQVLLNTELIIRESSIPRKVSKELAV
ncbi:MAG: substrate-binding domain-containing protein [Lachnospiraceae bacterium]